MGANDGDSWDVIALIVPMNWLDNHKVETSCDESNASRRMCHSGEIHKIIE